MTARLVAWARPRAKAIVAAVTAGLVAAQNAVPMPAAAHGWVAVAIAVLGVAAVYQVPNQPTKGSPTP